MDSQASTTCTVNCCDCDCSCNEMKRVWLRSVKRKFDEYDESGVKKFVIPGLVVPQPARIDMEYECVALREMVSSQQEAIRELGVELEEERNAASSAANEAMSMILRLQREKAESQMEFRQFKMFTEEKMAHDQQEIVALEDLLYKREQAIQSLTCEVQMYKHRMLSYGLLESEVEGSGDGRLIEDGFEVSLYDYPPLKCTTNESRVVGNEDVDVEKYAFEESPRFQDLQQRISQLENTPSSTQTDGEVFNNNVLEKAIVAQSSYVTNIEIGSGYIPDSPKLSGSVGRGESFITEEYSNVRRVKESPEVVDEMSDRVYTIDSIQKGVGHNGISEPKSSRGIDDDRFPRGSPNYPDFGDPEITKMYLRLQALEADRESMKQAIISMRTDKAQMILLKEIAQQLCREMSPVRRPPVKRSSLITSFSFMSIFKWIISFVLWRKKARRSKYLFGLSANSAGLQMLLDKGPRVGPWRCLSSTQV